MTLSTLIALSKGYNIISPRLSMARMQPKSYLFGFNVASGIRTWCGYDDDCILQICAKSDIEEKKRENRRRK